MKSAKDVDNKEEVGTKKGGSGFGRDRNKGRTEKEKNQRRKKNYETNIH